MLTEASSKEKKEHGEEVKRVVEEIKEELHLQEALRTKELKTSAQPVIPQLDPNKKFKEEERIAQEVLKKLQDKKINKPRWAL